MRISNYLILPVMLMAFIMLGAGCTTPGTLGPGSSAGKINSCAKESVPLQNYGDPGTRLSNCFVEYPGEPSRQDKYYYIVEEICGQFTQDFVENMLGQDVLRIEEPTVSSLYNCSYYLSEEPAGIGSYLWLSLDYLSVENQKSGHEMLGRTIKTDSRIPMEHFIVWQDDGQINEIYLVLGPDKFISINRSSADVLDNEKLIDFAARLGEAIKDYR